ncbi:unnamed protein product [Candida verbasci]|uniref:Uncharacterized protein n=1 Tax=Candida verbasci TaxID=1227364 RepID=A0A9W4TSV0_9ASCO|nr:unnamed protein product [Candida verbasci]
MVKASSRRKSSSATNSSKKSGNLKELSTSPRPEPKILQRRNSSFASNSSPWFRRNSFLSSSMIQNEEYSVYESTNFYNPTSFNSSGKFSNYNIISLKESQGFIFNQDLFATPYQQIRSLANEKRIKSNNSPNRRKSSISHIKNDSNKCERRHTSYHPNRPLILHNINKNSSNDNAIDDDDEDEEGDEGVEGDEGDEGDEDDEDAEMHDANDNLLTQVNINEYMENEMDDNNDEDEDEDEDEDDDNGTHVTDVTDEIDDEEDEREAEDEDLIDDDGGEDDEDDEDDEDEYHEMNGYGGELSNRRYKVRVTEIIIDEKDSDIFPT